MNSQEAEEILTRHLQMFNTHPYLSSPVIGSVVRMEEDKRDAQDASSIVAVKQSLMGPYAAIGDTFFWGALRPCAGIFAAAMVWAGVLFAPLAVILIYIPAHLWIRLQGFLEGYRKGKQGIEFIRKIDLPHIAIRVRWFSLVILSSCGLWLLRSQYSTVVGQPWILQALLSLSAILLCWWMIKKGISQIYILYIAAALLMIVSMRDLLPWWK